jgi:xanthine dehydrogenase accessory factor
VDPRPDMVTRERLPQAAELICDEPSSAVDSHAIGARTSVVIVSHTAEYDQQALRAVLGSAAGYIGMIGSARKIRTIYQRLREDGVSEDALERVHAPVGLDIGAETPAELALCIMAEIVAEENGKLPTLEPAAGQQRPVEGEA